MLIAFVGRMGSGKTLSMVKYAYLYYKAGYTIFSNINLNFDYKTYTLQDLIDYANENEDLKRVVILLDEAHIFLDSRSSISKRNRIISYFLLQTRKKGCHLFYTTQRFNQVDKRLRENTDTLCNCNTKKTSKGETYTVNNFNINTDNGVKVVKQVFKSQKYFSLYNTYEVVREV